MSIYRHIFAYPAKLMRDRLEHCAKIMSYYRARELAQDKEENRLHIGEYSADFLTMA